MKQGARVAVVGAGFWATTMHLPALSELGNVEIAAIVSRSKTSADKAAQTFGIPVATTSLSDVLNDSSIDLIDIVTPNHLHASIIEASAMAGKHVVCIKPLARSIEEATRAAEACEAAGVSLFYAENVPFIPAVHVVRRAVERGDLGHVFRVKACEGIPGPHSDWFFDREMAGGGVLFDMAVHSVAFCRSMVGEWVESVSAEVGTFVHTESTDLEDTSILTLRFPSGAIGQCEDSWSLAGAMDSRFEVFGTEARVQIDNLHRHPIQWTGGHHADTWSSQSPLGGDVMDGHLAMFRHFIDVLAGREALTSGANEALHDLAVVEAARLAAQTGKRQHVSFTPRALS